LLVTIAPFPEEVKDLEDRCWAKLDTVLFFNQKEPAKQQLPPRGRLFPFGKEHTTIELWHGGNWYHWKVVGSDPDAKAIEGNGTQLPRMYQRFWQGGPP